MEAIIGCYTEKGNPGLLRVREEKGALLITAEYAGMQNPTFFCVTRDQTKLYAGAEAADSAEGERCAVFSLDCGQFTPLIDCRTKGNRPCHVSLSEDEKRLFAANYADGTFCIYDVSNDSIRLTQSIPHEGRSINESRQSSAHLHQATQLPGTDIVNVVDLGMDAILSYVPDSDTGLYREIARTAVEPGFGPRHLCYGADGVTAYLCYELASRLSVLRWNGHGFDMLQTLPTLPEDFAGQSYCAAVKIAGNTLYVSNRGHDSIARFAILDGGLVELEGIYPIEVSYPRDFAVLADGDLLAAGQFGGGLKKLHWDGQRYVVTASLPLFAPVCVQILDV